MKAVRIHRYGGPEVLTYEEIEAPKPGLGEILVRNRAAGVNFTAIYARTGFLYELDLPTVLGKEGAGEVLAVGDGVAEFAVGDRIAYTETMGAYAEQTVVPAHYAVHIPAALSYETAAASMLKGLTAQYLLRHTFHVEPGQTVLVHAAAGGVGLILAQWANHLGATVIGTAGSAEKVELALQNGCHHVINYREEDFVAKVRETTKGEGCHVVYDGVGKNVAKGSLDCLRPRGYYVNFGWASGLVDPIDPMDLIRKGSLYVTSPGLTLYLAKREDVVANVQELFDVIVSGSVKIRTHAILPLTEAAEAHRQIQSRGIIGSIVLRP